MNANAIGKTIRPLDSADVGDAMSSHGNGDAIQTPASPVAPRLRVENIFVHYGGVRSLSSRQAPKINSPAVDPGVFFLNVPWAITAQSGQMIGVVGRSGEGKSSLLHALALLLSPAQFGSGRYEIPDADGRAVMFEVDAKGIRRDGETVSAELLRNQAFGFIFQQHFLLPCLDVKTNISLPELLRRDQSGLSERGSHLLQQLGVSQLADTVPDRVSGGQNQRVAVARGLIHAPAFLFADEPTANLDRESRQGVLAMLRAHADAGAIVFLISHELGDVVRWCDRVWVVSDRSLKYPFADPDDAGAEQKRALPRLMNPNVRHRPEECLGELVGALTKLVWPETEGGHRRGQPIALPPADPALSKPRLGLGRNIWGYALAELLSRQQFLARACLFVVVLLVAAFVAVGIDASAGVIDHLQRTVMKDRPYAKLIQVSKLAGLDNWTTLRAEARTIANVVGPAVFSAVGDNVNIALPDDRPGRSTGEPTFESFRVYSYDPFPTVFTMPADLANPYGIEITSGRAFTAADVDKAGLLVCEDWLANAYTEYGKPPHEVKYLEFVMPANDALDPNILKRVKRLKIPIIGRFRHTAARHGEVGRGDDPKDDLRKLPQLIVPRGFFERLQAKNNWNLYSALQYKTVNDDFLIPDDGGESNAKVPLPRVRSFSIESKDPARLLPPYLYREIPKFFAAAMGDPENLHGPSATRPLSNDKAHPEAFRIELELRPDVHDSQLVSKTTFDAISRKLIEFVNQRYHDSEYHAEIVIKPKLTSEQDPNLPPLRNWADMAFEPDRATVQVTSLEHLLQVMDDLKSKYQPPDINYEARLMNDVTSFLNLRKILLLAQHVVVYGAVFILAVVIAGCAYLQVTSRVADIGILRAHGMSASGIARVYTIEMLMLVIPAAMVGVVVGLVIARVSNPGLAALVGPNDTAVSPPGDGAAVDHIVFKSIHDGPHFIAPLLSGVTFGAAALGALSIVLTLGIIRRIQIVNALRGG